MFEVLQWCFQQKYLLDSYDTNDTKITLSKICVMYF